MKGDKSGSNNPNFIKIQMMKEIVILLSILRNKNNFKKWKPKGDSRRLFY